MDGLHKHEAGPVEPVHAPLLRPIRPPSVRLRQDRRTFEASLPAGYLLLVWYG